MQQENAADRLEAAVGAGHGLGIALHQLGQLAWQLRQPAIGLTQIGTGEIEPHQLGLRQGTAQLPQGASRAGGDIQHPNRTGGTRGEGLESAAQGREDPPPV